MTVLDPRMELHTAHSTAGDQGTFRLQPTGTSHAVGNRARLSCPLVCRLHASSIFPTTLGACSPAACMAGGTPSQARQQLCHSLLRQLLWRVASMLSRLT